MLGLEMRLRPGGPACHLSADQSATSGFSELADGYSQHVQQHPRDRADAGLGERWRRRQNQRASARQAETALRRQLRTEVARRSRRAGSAKAETVAGLPVRAAGLR